jgi:hypothetical protein
MKEINPKLVKKLHRHLIRKNHEKNRAMANAMVGVLRNIESVAPGEAEVITSLVA